MGSDSLLIKHETLFKGRPDVAMCSKCLFWNVSGSFALKILLLENPIITARKRSCRKVVFLHLSVSHSVHRGVYPSMQWGCTPPGSHSPVRSLPVKPPQADIPWADTPRQTPSRADTPPPEMATEAGVRYASYWNASLFRF